MAQYVYTMNRVGKVVPPKREILKDISLSFFPGAKIGVLGLNGSGKSTLLRIMAGVDQDYIGEARPQPGINVGYLPQEPELDEEKTVKEIVDESVAHVHNALAELDQGIREKLARSHASIGTDPDDTSARTFLQVTLGNLRPIRVFVVGAAARPGSYEVNSVSTMLTALYAAGGPAAGGSLRHLRLVRDGEVLGELDLYTYLLRGDRKGEI